MIICKWFLVVFFLLTGCAKDGSESPEKRENLQIAGFVYHRFGDNRYPDTNISLEDFEQQLSFLADNNFKVVSMGKAVELFYSKDTIPEKVVVITVDDAYKSFLTGAFPLLRKYNFPATLFVSTQMVGNPDYLTWNEIKMLQKNGIEIGNHSHGHHYFLNSEDGKLPEQFKKDLEKAEELFRVNLNYIPDLYAYPYGEYNSQMKNILRSKNYKVALAQNSGVIDHRSDFYALPRFPVGGNFTRFESFIEKVNMNTLAIEQKITSETNPPILKVKITDRDINTDQLQCFVDGSTDCRIIPQSDGWFTISTSQPLKNRRTLYTITAPGNNSSLWYWHSHLWVQPEIAE